MGEDKGAASGMSIDFEVAGENWKVAGKLMLPSTVPSLVGALYGRGSGGRSSPQKLWDKWCKILHSRPLLGLNFIIETSFFVLFFSYFQQLFKIKDSFLLLLIILWQWFRHFNLLTTKMN
jgi:hypothetical protein